MSDTREHESNHSTVRESAASRSQDVESQHARAPWGVKEWNSEGFPLVVIDGGQALVASIWPNGSQEATEANARLIAAVPELLQALQNSFDYFQGEHACGDFTCACNSCGLCEFREEIRTVLAKAKGEPRTSEAPHEPR